MFTNLVRGYIVSVNITRHGLHSEAALYIQFHYNMPTVFEALTFASFDLETLFLVCGYIFTISRPSFSMKVTRSRSYDIHTRRWSAFD